MPTPSGGYRTKDGKRVPGTTTITSMWGDKQGIIYAANRLALEPLLQVREIVCAGGNPSRFFAESNPDDWDHKKVWRKAADAGSLTHEMVDCYIHKLGFEIADRDPNLLKLAIPPFEAFLRWVDQSRLEIGETEQQLVSEVYRFGGTRDAMTVAGKRAIVDWKTSNSIYPEYLLQLAAYAILDEEHTGKPVEEFHLLRFSKQAKPDDPVRFTHDSWSHLDDARKGFLLLRELYGLMQGLEKLTK